MSTGWKVPPEEFLSERPKGAVRVRSGLAAPAERIGEIIVAAVFIGFWIAIIGGAIYGLVRFVHWAWYQ
jgi:hypothetical protein